MRYGYKEYQSDALETLRLFWRACRERDLPQVAFIETTQERHGLAHPYHSISSLANGESFPSNMPFVCLRVPTGGGKTVMGARAIRHFRDELSDKDHPLVLWLVPSEAIKDQTVKQMKDTRHPLRKLLEEELGNVEIFDGAEALSIQPNVIAGNTVILVSTIQSFRVDNTDGRKVYANSGALMTHFTHVPSSIKETEGFSHSLANVIRSHAPLVIVDEAHGARSELSLQTLQRFAPRAILELTATPITKKKDFPPSNVLHSVSAMQLKAEKMIKLPIMLAVEPGFQEILAATIAMRESLEDDAKAERKLTGEYLRPLALIQAEARSQERETLDVLAVKKALIEDHRIPEEWIVVHTGDDKGLKQVDLNAEECPLRFVITQSALKEGWDCPSAYVLCSVANLSSGTAVEQLLGRILRMPQAQEKSTATLNKAYAFVRCTNFYEAANALRDQMIKNGGFEAHEAREFFENQETQTTLALSAKSERVFPVTIHESVRLEDFSDDAKALVKSYEPETKRVVLIGKPTKQQANALVNAFQHEESKRAIQAAVIEMQQHARILFSPAERNEEFTVPQLMLELDGHVISPDEASWNAVEWQPPLPPSKDDLPKFDALRSTENAGFLDINGGRLAMKRDTDWAQHLNLIDIQENWELIDLVAWLDRNMSNDDLESDIILAWLNAVITEMQKSEKLGHLVRNRWELRKKLEARLAFHRQAAKQQEYQQLLFSKNSNAKIRVGSNYKFRYDPNAYPMRFLCKRSSDFSKHYYENVGDLDEKENAGEEFQCAQFIDSQPDVKWWVRNLERQAIHSFWLQTSTDRFYPDFVIQLNNGKVLVVEYKGLDRSTSVDTQEKELLGKLWEANSGGMCFFEMIKGKNEFPKIQEAIKKALTQ